MGFNEQNPEIQTEGLLRSLVDSLLDPMFFKDIRGIYRECNQAYCRHMGHSYEEIIGKSDFDLYPEETARVFRDVDLQILSTGIPWKKEFPGIKPDGAAIHYETLKVPYFGKDGKLTGIIGLARDVTDRRRLEQAFQRSELKYRRFIEQSEDGIILTDEHGIIVEWNRAQEEITGLPASETLGRPYLDVANSMLAIPISPEAYERMKDAIAQLLHTGDHPFIGKANDFLIRRRDGCERFIQNLSFPVQSANGFLLGSIQRDVTEIRGAQEALSRLNKELEQRVTERTARLEALTQELEAEISEREQAEQALRSSEERYKSLFNEVPTGLFHLSEDIALIDANAVMREMLGITLPQHRLQHQDILNLFVDPTDVVILRALLQHSGRAHGFQTRLRRADGSTLWVEANILRIVDAEGNVHYQGSLTDISDRKRSEALQNAIYSITEAANSVQNLETLYPLVHKIINDLIPAKNIFIVLHDPQTDLLSYPYYVDEMEEDPVYPDQTFSMKEMENSLTWHIIREGRSFLVTAQEMYDLHKSGELQQFGTMAVQFLGVPLKNIDQKVIGAIAVQTYTEGEGYHLADQEMLSFVSTQIAIAIERKRAEESLRLQSEALAAAADSIFITNRQGIILWANPAFSTLTGYDPADAAGQHIFFLTSEDSPILNPDQWVEAFSGRGWKGEQNLRRKDGSAFVAEMTVTPVTSSGQPDASQFITILRDITQRKQMEVLEEDRTHVMEMIAQDRPLEDTLKTAALMLRHQNPNRTGAIHLLENGELKLVDRQDSLSGGGLEAVNRVLLEHHELWSAAIFRHEKVLIHDVDQDERWKQALSVPLAACSLYLAPIQSGKGEILGLLTVFSRQPGGIRPHDQDFFENVSYLAAMAIERIRLNDRLVHLAMFDSLTGLPNRHLLEDRLEQSLTQARRAGRMVGLIYLDLDHFKEINESLGHIIGDVLLKEVAQRLAQSVRESDSLARLGGDDFVVILNNLREPGEVLKVIEKLMEAMRPAFIAEEHELYINANVGYTLFPQDGEDVRTLLMNGESALAYAKNNEKSNIVRFETFMNTMVIERLSIISRLRRAVDQNEMVLYYQPQVELVHNRIIGAEALIRWHVPGIGMIPPDNFIPLAEDSGLIHPIGDWVIAETCRQQKAWAAAGLPPLKISINVSPRQFSRSDFLDRLVHTIGASGMDPDNLVVEITESVFMRDIEEISLRMKKLESMGIEVHVDDFGKEYSSFSYLQHLPVKCLKIDKTFIDGLASAAESSIDPTALVNAMITLAHALKLKVLAEGVETEEQANILRSLGCDYAQGYYFARPLPSTDLWNVIRGYLP